MADFNAFVGEVKTQVSQLAQNTLNEFRTAALDDANAFLNQVQADLQLWTTQLTQGLLKQDEFEDLVKGEKDLAQMQALKTAGLAQARLDAFVNGVIDAVISAAFKTYL
jgi:hypothetical protein